MELSKPNLVTGGESLISEEKLKRVELVRALVLETLHIIENTSKKEEALVNLFGVSSFASLLAIRREQSSEIAAIAGLLHDFYFDRLSNQVRQFLCERFVSGSPTQAFS
ncbi:hypothetical protein P5G61_29165, partial [Paenibacillus sp. F6_3S_P_1C]|nr:hypothetical protein [Paenibacillus vandeheii]